MVGGEEEERGKVVENEREGCYVAGERGRRRKLWGRRWGGRSKME